MLRRVLTECRGLLRASGGNVGVTGVAKLVVIGKSEGLKECVPSLRAGYPLILSNGLLISGCFERHRYFQVARPPR